MIFPVFEIPNWAARLVVILLLLCFPVALVLSWAYKLTLEGIKRTEEVAPHASITHRTGQGDKSVNVLARHHEHVRLTGGVAR